MKSKALVALVAVVFISGCSTPGDMRKRPADLELASDRTAKSVAVCIADRWENGNALSALGLTYPITTRPLENGYTVSISSYPTLFADIVDQGAGSMVRFYRDPVSPGFEVDVRKCASK